MSRSKILFVVENRIARISHLLQVYLGVVLFTKAVRPFTMIIRARCMFYVYL